MSVRRLAWVLLAALALQGAAAAWAASSGPCCPGMAMADEGAPMAPCGGVTAASCCEASAPVSLPEAVVPPAAAGAAAAAPASLLALPAAAHLSLAPPRAALPASARGLRSTVLRL